MTGSPHTFAHLAGILASAGGDLSDSAVVEAFVASGIRPAHTAAHDWDALKAEARAIRAGLSNPYATTNEEAA